MNRVSSSNAAWFAPFLSACAAFALLLPGCGGGATSGIEPIYLEWSLELEIASRDGGTADLAGVVVECLETGETTVSDAGGRCRLSIGAGESLLPSATIVFTDPRAGTPRSTKADPREDSDADGDGLDVQGSVVAVVLGPGAVGPSGESPTHPVAIEGGAGEVAVFYAAPAPPAVERSGEGTLAPSGTVAADARSGGEVEVAVFGGCSSIEVEVDGAVSAKGALEVRFTSPEGKAVLGGHAALDPEGQAHFAAKACDGEPFPFGIASVDEMKGWTIWVVDGNGQVVFAGTVPSAGVDAGG